MDATKTGKFIAELRKEKNMTQAQLAESLFVSDKAISRWETGKGFPEISNLDSIAGVLGISASELLKGERLGEEITKEDVHEITDSSLSVFKSAIRRTGIVNLLIGLILSMVLITFVIVQLTAPSHIAGAANALTIETLSDGRVVAVLDESAAGCYVEEIKEPEGNITEKTVSCYYTLWYKWFGDKQEKLVVIGDVSDVATIYYYPGVNQQEGGENDPFRRRLPENELIYKSGGAVYTDVVITLPRLIYNYWLLIGFAVGIVGLLIYLIFRKKRAGALILKLALFPISLSLSNFLSLLGRRGQVYDAPHYFIGIILLALLIYAFLLAIQYRRVLKLRNEVQI